MKRFLYFIKIAVVSPEFVFLALMALLVYLYPSMFIELSSKVNPSNELIQWISILPAGITGIIVSRKSELLSPGSDEMSKILLCWPNYYKIEYRFWICLFFSALGALGCIYVSFFGELKDHLMMAIFISGILVSLITFLTFLSATIELKRILSMNS